MAQEPSKAAFMSGSDAAAVMEADGAAGWNKHSPSLLELHTRL